MKPVKIIAATAVLLAGLTGSAMAGSIPISFSDDFGGDAPSYTTVDETFSLPVGATGVSLNITTFAADDRSVLELNGTQVSDTGIFGPGNGSFFYTDGGPVVPFTFDHGDSDTVWAPITGPFVIGSNDLFFIVNNTNDGIFGGPSGGPSSLTFDATVTYSGGTTGVPEPLTLSLFGAGLAEAAAMRRRKKAKA